MDLLSCCILPLIGSSPCYAAGLDLENDAAAANQLAPSVTHVAWPPSHAKLPTYAVAHEDINNKSEDYPAAHRNRLPEQPHISEAAQVLLHTNDNGCHIQQQPQGQREQQQYGAGPDGQSLEDKAAEKHGRVPANWQRPSDMLIPRASIFYCSSFSISPGLPQHSECIHFVQLLV